MQHTYRPLALTAKQLAALERPRGATHFNAYAGELKKPVLGTIKDLDVMAGVLCVVEFGSAKTAKGVTTGWKALATPATYLPTPAQPELLPHENDHLEITLAPKPGKPVKPAKPGKVSAKAPSVPATPPKPAKRPAAPGKGAPVVAKPAKPVPPTFRKKPIGRTKDGATFSGISATEMARVAGIVKAAGLVVPKDATKAEEVIKARLRKSVIENPVAYAWEFFDTHREMRRKDIIATLVEHGLAFYTARSQYQMWRTAGKADAAAKLAAPELKLPIQPLPAALKKLAATSRKPAAK